MIIISGEKNDKISRNVTETKAEAEAAAENVIVATDSFTTDIDIGGKDKDTNVVHISLVEANTDIVSNPSLLRTIGQIPNLSLSSENSNLPELRIDVLETCRETLI